MTSFWLFIFEKWCKSTFKKYYAEKLFLNSFFVAILKVNDENRRIRIRIPIRIQILIRAWIRGSGSGSTPKCHGSGTLPIGALLLRWRCPPGALLLHRQSPLKSLLLGWTGSLSSLLSRRTPHLDALLRRGSPPGTLLFCRPGPPDHRSGRPFGRTLHSHPVHPQRLVRQLPPPTFQCSGSDPLVFGPPDPEPLVRGMDPAPDPPLDPDPSIIKQKYQNSKKNLDSYCLWLFLTFYLWKMMLMYP